VIDGNRYKAFRADVAVSGGKVAGVGDLAAYKPRAHSIAPGRSSRPGSSTFTATPISSSGQRPRYLARAVRTPGHDDGSWAVTAGSARRRSRSTRRSDHRGEPADRRRRDRPRMGKHGRISRCDREQRRCSEYRAARRAGSVRAAVSGHLNPAPPTIDELGTMERLAKQALDDGCIGISTGLGYPPASSRPTTSSPHSRAGQKPPERSSPRICARTAGSARLSQRSRADSRTTSPRSKRSYV